MESFFYEHEIPSDFKQIFKRPKVTIIQDFEMDFKPFLINEIESFGLESHEYHQKKAELVENAQKHAEILRNNTENLFNLAADVLSAQSLLDLQKCQDENTFKSLNEAYLQATSSEDEYWMLRNSQISNELHSIANHKDQT